MQIKKVSIFLILAFVLVFIITMVFNFYDREEVQENSTTIEPAIGTTNLTASVYTLAEVAIHSNASSCWSVVRNNVYNLTSWINQHPGGKQAIIGLCGKDGTAAFEGKHSGQSRPQNELAGLSIGTLKQ